MHLGIYPRSYPRSTLVRMLTLALLDTRHPPVNFQLSCISCSSPMTQKSHFGYWDKYPTALASPCALTAGEKTPFSFGSGAGGVFSPHIFGSSKVESVLMASIKKLQISVTVHLFLISWYFLHPTSDSFFFFPTSDSKTKQTLLPNATLPLLSLLEAHPPGLQGNQPKVPSLTDALFLFHFCYNSVSDVPQLMIQTIAFTTNTHQV